MVHGSGKIPCCSDAGGPSGHPRLVSADAVHGAVCVSLLLRGMSRSCIHIFFSGRALKLIRLDHRPDRFVFPAVATLNASTTRGSLRVAYCKPATGRPNPTSLDAIRERYSKLSKSELSLLNCRCANLAPWSFTWRERPAWKRGHWEHLDVTHETSNAQGAALSFPHPEITKVADGPKEHD